MFNTKSSTIEGDLKHIQANIGDAHAMGNKPITFIRQVRSKMISSR